MELNLKLKGGIHSFTSKFLVGKAIAFADVGSSIAFNAILALLIYGIVLFPHNIPWVVLHFIFVCRVVFERLKVELVVAHRADF